MRDDGLFDVTVAATYDTDHADRFAPEVLGPAVDLLAGLTQDAQVACFANAAAHLAPGGRFVIEAGVPPLRRLTPGSNLVAHDASERHVGVDEIDVVAQRMTCHHTYVRGDGTVSLFRSHHRYASPAEYDLMARLAGLELLERWADWDRTPCTTESTSHVSVWQRPIGCVR